jgi:two-component sensor histidine kinase
MARRGRRAEGSALQQRLRLFQFRRKAYGSRLSETRASRGFAVFRTPTVFGQIPGEQPYFEATNSGTEDRRQGLVMTLTARVFLLVALAAAPTSALLIFDNYQRLQQREADAEQEALRSTRLVSAELDQIFKGIESLLRAAAQTPMVSAFQNPECTDYLRRLEGINPNAGRLVAVDATGQVRCGATARLTGVADRDYYHAALKSDDLVVGGYTIGRGSGAPILPLAVRFATSEGTGVLVSGLRLDWLREHFSRIFGAFPARSSLTIVDRDGIILVRLPNADRAGQPLQNYEYVVHAPQPGVFRSTAEKNADGVARFLGFTPIESPPRGVAIAVGFPQATVLAEARASALRNGVLTALAAILAFSAAALAGRAFIHRPVSELLAVIERWRTGDLGARAQPASGRSEFDQLGKAFNSMAAELESALQHKEVLLRELSHRIMNSLQTISALFRLQASSMKELPTDAAQFAEAIRRIDALALAYKRIKAVQGVESMDFAAFLVELCNDLRASVMEGNCVVKADPLMIAPEQAIPLSLIVNELLTNAVKHGSKGDALIAVELASSPEQCRLVVRNEGSWPGESRAAPKGFGTRMISAMVCQLRGTLEVSSADGRTEFAVTFRPGAPGDQQKPLK